MADKTKDAAEAAPVSDFMHLEIWASGALQSGEAGLLHAFVKEERRLGHLADSADAYLKRFLSFKKRPA